MYSLLVFFHSDTTVLINNDTPQNRNELAEGIEE